MHQQNLQQSLGVVEGLVNASYQHRHRTAIIQFGNQQVHTLLPPGRPPKRILPLLRNLPAGGGTPLRNALTTGLQLLTREARKRPGESQHLYLISDCKSLDSIADLKAHIPITLIDTESGPVRLNRGALLAQQLGARHLHIKQLSDWSEA